MRSKIFNSKAYQVFDYICRLIILNILLIICSFSIFLIIQTAFKDLDNVYKWLSLIPTLLTIGPSMVAIFATIKDYELIESTGTFKEFFRNFKKYYLKTILSSIILIVFGILLINSLNYFYGMRTSGVGYVIGFVFSISFILIYLMCFIHLPLSFIYFDGIQIMHHIKLALIFAFKDLGRTLILVILVVLSLVLSYYFSLYLLLLGFSLPIYFLIKLTKSKYIKISERNKE
ncbi:MAG: YesL family protein [Bacilli bacterium]|nr:YesL family protein [Bacilli bacterium]